MRRKNESSLKILQELRELYDQKEDCQEDGREVSFAAQVKDEMNWIDQENILGGWGNKGADIRYDSKEFGKRCRDARVKKRYSLKGVATHLSYKSHSYLSEIERGKKKVDPVMLETLSLLYHVMPKYLLGLEEQPLVSPVFVADRYIDKCRFLIQNSISDPKAFGLPSKRNLNEILDYIKNIIMLGCLPVSAVCNILEISIRMPSLQKIKTTKEIDMEKFPQGLRKPPQQLISLSKDAPEYEKVNNVWGQLQNTLDSLYETNPEWLVFIAHTIAEGPEYFPLLINIVKLGGFAVSEMNISGESPNSKK